MNLGKAFEQNFRKSIPNDPNIYYYRLKDSASSYYGGNDNLRFSQSNIADAFLFSSGDLLIIELKHHKGKSIPISCIRKNQIDGMTEASEKLRVIPFLIVFFSDVERCFALRISDYNKFVEENDRKSIPISYFEEKAIEINVTKLRTNYRFDVSKFLLDY